MMKYRLTIDNNSEIVDDYDLFDNINRRCGLELEDEFDTFLDDIYGEIDIAGISYSTSTILSNIDNVRYSFMYDDFIGNIVSTLKEDGEYIIGNIKLALEEVA